MKWNLPKILCSLIILVSAAEVPLRSGPALKRAPQRQQAPQGNRKKNKAGLIAGLTVGGGALLTLLAYMALRGRSTPHGARAVPENQLGQRNNMSNSPLPIGPVPSQISPQATTQAEQTSDGQSENSTLLLKYGEISIPLAAGEPITRARATEYLRTLGSAESGQQSMMRPDAPPRYTPTRESDYENIATPPQFEGRKRNEQTLAEALAPLQRKENNPTNCIARLTVVKQCLDHIFASDTQYQSAEAKNSFMRILMAGNENRRNFEDLVAPILISKMTSQELLERQDLQWLIMSLGDESYNGRLKGKLAAIDQGSFARLNIELLLKTSAAFRDSYTRTLINDTSGDVQLLAAVGAKVGFMADKVLREQDKKNQAALRDLITTIAQAMYKQTPKENIYTDYSSRPLEILMRFIRANKTTDADLKKFKEQNKWAVSNAYGFMLQKLGNTCDPQELKDAEENALEINNFLSTLAQRTTSISSYHPDLHLLQILATLKRLLIESLERSASPGETVAGGAGGD